MAQQGNGRERKTLYLIDGYAAVFRSYYAIRRPLFSPVTGEETQAILVFARMLHKLYTTLAPDYVVVAWDAPGGSFRDALFRGYFPAEAGEIATEPTSTEPDSGTPPVDGTTERPGYKGTRQATPGGLHAQVPRILELLRLLGVPVIGKPGLEADDVIATLTSSLVKPEGELRVRIVSRDKDMEQLLADGPDGSPQVTLFDVHTGEEYGRAELWTRRGVRPEQVPDLLALTGDVVDNVPGIPGVGGRTAAKWLQEFGSLDGVLENLDRIAPSRLREPLEKARPLSLPLSRRLVTLERDSDLADSFVLDSARVGQPLLSSDAVPALCSFFENLGFGTLRAQFLTLAE